jgi:hypothetical protein
MGAPFCPFEDGMPSDRSCSAVIPFSSVEFFHCVQTEFLAQIFHSFRPKVSFCSFGDLYSWFPVSSFRRLHHLRPEDLIKLFCFVQTQILTSSVREHHKLVYFLSYRNLSVCAFPCLYYFRSSVVTIKSQCLRLRVFYFLFSHVCKPSYCVYRSIHSI